MMTMEELAGLIRAVGDGLTIAPYSGFAGVSTLSASGIGRSLLEQTLALIL